MSKNAKVAPAPATGTNILPSFQRLLDAAKSRRVLKAKDTKKRQDVVFILENNNKLFPPAWIRLIIPLSTIPSHQFGDQETSIFIIFILCYPGLWLRWVEIQGIIGSRFRLQGQANEGVDR
jgi:hypothetical protein